MRFVKFVLFFFLFTVSLEGLLEHGSHEKKKRAARRTKEKQVSEPLRKSLRLRGDRCGELPGTMVGTTCFA